jgi:hypothetical protein
MPHWRKLAWQPTLLACLRTRCTVGSSSEISRAMIEITTSSSIRVKAVRLIIDRG